MKTLLGALAVIIVLVGAMPAMANEVHQNTQKAIQPVVVPEVTTPEAVQKTATQKATQKAHPAQKGHAQEVVLHRRGCFRPLRFFRPGRLLFRGHHRRAYRYYNYDCGRGC